MVSHGIHNSVFPLKLIKDGWGDFPPLSSLEGGRERERDRERGREREPESEGHVNTSA